MNLLDIYSILWYCVSTFFELFVTNLFRWKTKFESDVRLDGKIVVITGATTGIGKQTALDLSSRGAKVSSMLLYNSNIMFIAQVIIGCLNEERDRIGAQEIRDKSPDPLITVLKLDLSSLTSVRKFAEEVSESESRIDILINNAGVYCNQELRSEDGYEMQFATNYLGE